MRYKKPLKKFSTIFLLSLYFNAAFAIGIDCTYCEGKITSATLHRFATELSNTMPMGCCRTETLTCKTDNHVAPIVAVFPGSSFNQLLPILPVFTKLEFPKFIRVSQFGYYYFKRATTCRDILSFIHILRI